MEHTLTDLTPEEWGERYRRERSYYESLTAKLYDLLKELLASNGIDVVQVDQRTKTAESFIEKISRKKDKYRDPLVEINDIVGLRIIAYYTEDVETIGRLIKREFSVDLKNSVDKVTELDPSQFGYTSVHYVASLGSTRRDLPEWSRYKGKTVEIQVRTALQHAWAAVDHKLRYKTTQEVPSNLRRRLFRLSALFELADDQFSDLRRASEALLSRYSQNVRRGNLDLELDASSLNAYLSLTPWLERIVDLALQAGWSVNAPEDVEDSEVELDKRDLLNLTKQAGLTDIAGLDRILSADEEHLKHQFETLGRALEKVHHGTISIGRTPYDILTILLLHELKANKDIVSSTYVDHIWEGLKLARESEETK